MTTQFLNTPAQAHPHTVTSVSAQTSFAVRNDVEIRRGFACLSFSQAGRRQIVEFLLPRDHLYAGDYEENPGFQIVALSEVELIPLSAERASAEQRAWRKARSLAIARQSLINIGTRQSLPRCAHLFCELFIRCRAAGLVQDLSFPLPLRQCDIADALGLTPVHLNRTLRRLREKGLLSWKRGVLHIHDFKQLQRCCDFDAGYLAMPGEHPWRSADSILPDKARPVLTLRPHGDAERAPGRQ
jgi:CRP-like cAMP-binding protein